MNLKNEVCSLESAKRLKELNVKQDSLWYWWVLDKSHPLFEVHKKTKTEESLQESLNGKIMLGEDIYKNVLGEFIHYSAFTASELGDILPNCVTTKEGEPFNNFRIEISKFFSVGHELAINNWIVNYHCDSTEIHGDKAFFVRKLAKNIYDPNLANAMAKMLVYLIENGLIK